jgi:hypothetical protein
MTKQELIKRFEEEKGVSLKEIMDDVSIKDDRQAYYKIYYEGLSNFLIDTVIADLHHEYSIQKYELEKQKFDIQEKYDKLNDRVGGAPRRAYYKDEKGEYCEAEDVLNWEFSCALVALTPEEMEKS